MPSPRTNPMQRRDLLQPQDQAVAAGADWAACDAALTQLVDVLARERGRCTPAELLQLGGATVSLLKTRLARVVSATAWAVPNFGTAESFKDAFK